MALSNPVRLALAGAVAAVAIGAVAFARDDAANATTQATDDAYVEADITRLPTRVAGSIARVLVQDHQAVRAGDPLVQIDERDLKVTLEAARAEVAGAQATVAGLRAQLARQDSLQRQARAALAGDEAALAQAEANRRRYAGMAKDGSGTQQAAEQADTAWRVQQAGQQRDAAALAAVAQQDAVIRADLLKAEAHLAVAQATLQQAELNMSYARVTAPVDGVVAQLAARTGAYVQPGQALLSLVPLNAVYVTANFKETQLAHMRPGQAVRLQVDGLPDLSLKGHVESLAPASGISFSPVPPHNATGNFTKIVQRLPVRIAIDPNQPGRDRLRVGMSVRPEVDVRSMPDAAAKAAAADSVGERPLPLPTPRALTSGGPTAPTVVPAGGWLRVSTAQVAAPVADSASTALATPRLALTLVGARLVVQAAQQEAARHGWSIGVAVVDAAGELLAFERHDAAIPIVTSVAQGKARTAALLRAPSKEFEDFINGGKPSFLATPGTTPLEGGVPLVLQGQVVGAVGISGAHGANDSRVAAAAARALAVGKAVAAPVTMTAPPARTFFDRGITPA